MKREYINTRKRNIENSYRRLIGNLAVNLIIVLNGG